MKYSYILVAMVFMGCSDKSPELEKVVEPVVTQVQKVSEPVVEVAPVVTQFKEVVKPVIQVEPVRREALRSNETMVAEPTVTKSIGSDIPTSCAMWSDGSNICTRVSSRKASCTTNPVGQKMFSCLQWQ